MIRDRSRLCLTISCVIMLAALTLTIFGLGINLGLDFTGGLSMQYKMNSGYQLADVETALKELNVGAFSVAQQGQDEVLVRIGEITEDNINTVQNGFEEKLTAKYPAMERVGDVNYVGPVAGRKLVTNALMSVLIATALMLVYIAIRFDLNSGLAAVFGLVHDVLIMLSFMVLLRNFVQMNSSFIAAMLTIVGYSINNTIVIFDRIRENNRKLPAVEKVEIVNRSVKECLGRTINTTVTTLITIVCLYILGVRSIKEFALPIIIGILSGVYSANMINGYIWARLETARENRKGQKKAKTA